MNLDRTSSPNIARLEFCPDLRPEDLNIFLERIRAGMPQQLWKLIAPYTAVPRAYDPSSYGVAEPMESETTSGPWVCEVHAPVPWHRIIPDLDSIELTNTRMTLENLAAVWDLLRDNGHRPSIAVNLAPSRIGETWLIEVVAVVADGDVDRTLAADVSMLLCGQFAVIQAPPIGAIWRCHD
ncbi:hypothetical protein [Nocardia noduli]|uniref:hypothetical protein n=1 Tax=Nocardia noduli TaxID=2815722 RepID=UPI001C23EB00|nr:hypothetical protein [Nocardia noduli]